MPSETPKYALPYPVGTDRVMDGDNAMQALAERVEAVLGTGRVWTAKQGNPVPVPVNAWTVVVEPVLTGCPIGSLVVVSGVVVITNGTGCLVSAAVGATGGTVQQSFPRSSCPAGGYVAVPVVSLLTVTAANPTAQLSVNVSAGSPYIDSETHLTAWRIT